MFPDVPALTTAPAAAYPRRADTSFVLVGISAVTAACRARSPRARVTTTSVLVLTITMRRCMGPSCPCWVHGGSALERVQRAIPAAAKKSSVEGGGEAGCTSQTADGRRRRHQDVYSKSSGIPIAYMVIMTMVRPFSSIDFSSR